MLYQYYKLLSPLLTIGVFLVTTGPVIASATFECLIEPMVTAQVGSPVQGVVDELLVDRSQLVKQGDPIATLKSTVEQAQLKQARARAMMSGEITAREADLKLAHHNMTRMKNLYDKKMVSTQQRDESLAQLHVAKAALRQAQDNLVLFQHDLMRIEEMLEQRTIRSPVTGVVVEQHTFPGEFIYDNPIMTIAQLNPLRIEVVLQAELFGQFKPGDKAIVHPEIKGSSPLVATVDIVDKLLDTFSGTFGVRLVLDNPNLSITGGQKCQLEFSESAGEVAASAE